MKKLLYLLVLLLALPALGVDRRSIPRLETTEEFRPPITTNCALLTDQRLGDLCFDTNADADGDGTPDGVLYVYTQDGWTPTGGGSAVAPTDVGYIVKSADPTLTNEQALDALTAGGLVKTDPGGTGALATATADVDYAAPSHTHTGLGTGDVSSDISSSTASTFPVWSNTSGKLLTAPTYQVQTTSVGDLLIGTTTSDSDNFRAIRWGDSNSNWDLAFGLPYSPYYQQQMQWLLGHGLWWDNGGNSTPCATGARWCVEDAGTHDWHAMGYRASDGIIWFGGENNWSPTSGTRKTMTVDEYQARTWFGVQPYTGNLIFEGSVADSTSTTVGIRGTLSNSTSAFTAARTWTWPDASGSIVVSGSAATGDLTGTYASPSVVDDSHNHTTTTISGLNAANDISSGTLPTARGGTNQTTWNAGMCVQVNGTGDGLVSASAACGTGGGGGGGGAAGSDTQVQFNDSDALAGDAGFTYDKTTDKLTVAGGITISDNTTASEGNLLQLNDNGTDLTPDPTCANKGGADTLTVVDSDESGTARWDVCGGSTVDRVLWRFPTPSTSTGQALFATGTSGAPAFRAILESDLPANGYAGTYLNQNSLDVDWSADIGDTLGCGGNQGVRRNAGDTDWECFTPATATIPTHTEPFVLYDTDGLAAVDLASIYRAPANITVTEVWCESNSANASTFTLEKDGGNDLTTGCSCSSTGAACTLTGVAGDKQYADGALLDLRLTAVGASTTRISIHVEYTYD